MMRLCVQPLILFFRRFLFDDRGHFGVLTALILLPLLACTGAAVDVSHAFSLRAAIREAADAAVLDALSDSALKDILHGAAITDDQLVRLARRAEQNFADMLPSEVRTQTGAAATATIRLRNGRFTASLEYTGAMKTSFMRILGFDTLPTNGSAQSMADMPRFTDVHILIDNSPSMTLAANGEERIKLMSVTGDHIRNQTGIDGGGCSFACHNLDTNPDTESNYYALARLAGIKLRIDTVKDALLQIFESAGTNSERTREFRYSLYDLGSSMASARTSPVTNRLRNETDLDRVKAVIENVDAMSTPFASYDSKAGSNLELALEEMQFFIPRAGNGATEGSRQQLLIFVTDGVSNSLRNATCAGQRWAPLGQCIGPLQTAICDQLKRRGIRIAILNTVYLPIPASPYFVYRVAPFLGQVQPNLQTCASPGLFRTVNYGESVDDALKSLFRESVHTVWLSH